MLPRAHRLPSPSIRDVMRTGKRAQNGSLQIVFKKNSLNTPRFAIVVPLSFDKRATARNRARRLVSESLRMILPEFESGWDAVFFVRKGLPDTQKAIEPLVRTIVQVLSSKL